MLIRIKFSYGRGYSQNCEWSSEFFCHIQSGDGQSRSDMAAPVIRMGLLLEAVLQYPLGVAIVLLSEMAMGNSHHRHKSGSRMEERRNRTLSPF